MVEDSDERQHAWYAIVSYGMLWGLALDVNHLSIGAKRELLRSKLISMEAMVTARRRHFSG